MQILIAKHAGFCFGVKKAIDIAREVAAKNDGKTYVFGQLVHNEKVISDLENEGLVFAEKIEDIPDNAVTVLRAHGEPGTTYANLEKKSIAKGRNLNDATCPLVTLVHNVAIRLKNSDYEVILFGKHNHPEAIGTSYHLKGKDTFIVEEPEHYNSVVEYIKKNDFSKVAIISQTTMSVDGYSQLIKNINSNSDYKFAEIPLNMKNLDIKYGFVDTICMPTKQRQTDTEEIARKSDVMIVIGGKNSSNTKELAAKCRSLGVETHFIQSEGQLQKEWIEGKNTVGVSAGASTPDEVIEGVVRKIKDIEKSILIKK
ncbi:4-hydroxy-3-methylbut-2-enyl diphosphate reductase [Candidatus Woesearchaeota archaeon]|nr:4-hydroxy-3-methylbut-2-enyl diphosphate reductase [Candidatus Woesearchaeota archaeon]MBI2661284.1 4-hydroxy-3-methylbut-2-enyl diphosphate reductase [Candidatus Woesearchaeota archaeon]